jgi:hypothetical protein
MTFKVRDFPTRDAMLHWFNDRQKECNINVVFHQILKKDDGGYEVFYQDYY